MVDETQKAMKPRNACITIPDSRRRIPVTLLALSLLSLAVREGFAQSAAPVQSPPQQAQSQVMTTTSTEQAPAENIAPEQLDALVAPIALYPDPLLAQTLAASTYPLEVIQLQQWLDRNKNLKDKALADAVAKQSWDPSVQALAISSDVVQRLAGNIQWTTDLGNAFLAQQSDVLEAVQRMRGKAESKGTLKTSAQQTVETKTVEGGKQVIVVEPANPQVVYVPSYDPAVVYGPPPPAYPYYPYSYPGYYPGMGLAWGAAGFALGAWAGGNWGNCNWGSGDININNNNNFNRNSVNQGGNRNNVNRGQAGQGGRWQHNSSHRGNAPYGDKRTADKFGGNTRASQGNRAGQGAGAGNRPSQLPGGGAGNRNAGGASNRTGGAAGAGNRPGGAGAANRPGGSAAGARPSTRPAGGSASTSVGNRTASSRPSASTGGGLSGGSGNYARSSSSRGGSSMGGGGFSRSGGSYGGSRG